MDFLQLVQARQSDRSYDKQRPVEPEKLERILEAARLAPSACNAQPWKFVVITDKELAQKAGKAAAGLGMNKFAKDAPVHILVVEESYLSAWWKGERQAFSIDRHWNSCCSYCFGG